MSVKTQIKSDYEQALRSFTKRQGEPVILNVLIFDADEPFFTKSKDSTFKGLERDWLNDFCLKNNLQKSTKKEATRLVVFEKYDDDFGWLVYGRNHWLK